MIKNDKLYRLVSSLSKNEKRYFTLYTKRFVFKEVQLSKLLFDVVVQLKSYDEDKVLKKLGRRVNKKRLSVEKVRLYKLILDSLQNYHSSSHPELELLDKLQRIKILSLKGLNVEAQKLVNKYKQTLEEDNFNIKNTEYLLRLIGVEQRQFQQFSQTNAKQQRSFDEICEEYEQTLDRLQENHSLNAILPDFYSILKKSSRDPNQKDLLNGFMENPVLAKEPSNQSFRNQCHWLRGRYSYYFTIKSYAKAQEVIVKELELIEQTNAFLSIDSSSKNNKESISLIHLNVLCTILESYIYCPPKSETKIEELLTRIRAILEEYNWRNKMNNDLVLLFLRTYSLELHYYINKKDFSKIRSALEQYQKIKKDYWNGENYLHQKYDDNQLIFALFSLGEYDMALVQSNLSLQGGKKAYQYIENYHRALFFTIIIHFELENYRFLDYQIDNVKRGLRQIEAPLKLEFLILKYLQKIIAYLPNSKEQKELFLDLYKNLVPLLDEPFERHEQFYFDYWNWALLKS